MTQEASDAARAIRFEHCSVEYPGGVRALRDLTLDVSPGEFVVVVGLSGAGKSTMLRTVNGLVRPTGGDVTVGGRSIRRAGKGELREIRARIGMVFQDFRLVKRARVLTNVLMGRVAYVPTWRAVSGWWPKPDVELAFRALERVGIVDKAYVRASNLSGGQQQRVGVARALAQEPSIILADEPVASLDPVTAHQVMRDLLRINRELGITTLVNLHFLDLAKAYGERIVGLRAGELVYDGSAAAVGDDDFRAIYGRSPSSEDLLESQPALS
ncbi:MAG: phosphonate ABC transporter ATP-binding protein [Actinomycetota bacterium]|nr:phosphonate ABC transporter ATP-binding protein [Actinomycetota bacterium]